MIESDYAQTEIYKIITILEVLLATFHIPLYSFSKTKWYFTGGHSKLETNKIYDFTLLELRTDILNIRTRCSYYIQARL